MKGLSLFGYLMAYRKLSEPCKNKAFKNAKGSNRFEVCFYLSYVQIVFGCSDRAKVFLTSVEAIILKQPSIAFMKQFSLLTHVKKS
jgi:hypothetical protein